MHAHAGNIHPTRKAITMKTWLAFILAAITLCIHNPGDCSAREVVYAFDQDFPPFSYFEDGNASGFDIEVLQAALHGKDFQITFQPMDWETVQDELAKGSVHLTSGMAMTEDRKEAYDFTNIPLTNLNINVFIKEGEGAPSSLGDLKGKRVATQRGSLYQELLETLGGDDVALYDTEPEALKALAEGNAQAFGGAEKTARYYIKKNGYQGIRTIGTPLKITKTYFVAAKGNDDLVQAVNEGLRKMMENGSYDRIYRKWFVDELGGEEVEKLISKAKEVSANAYAPYSNFQVGAAVLTRSGKIYTGCNVENALYGLCATALKVAVFKAISEGDSEIKAAVNVLPDGDLAAPSADDRQLLYEFGRGILVIMGSENESRRTVMASELLPYAFDMR